MKDRIKELFPKIEKFNSSAKEELENFRAYFFSAKKGVINELFDEFKNAAKEDKKEIGLLLNELKNKAQEKFNYLKSKMTVEKTSSISNLDTSLPVNNNLGSLHPISIIKKRIIKIFSQIGFTLSEGPEIEGDWNVFSALNFPINHPARAMQDTFFINKSSDTIDDILLRTHTSSVQVRTMNSQQPPIRTISPGRVFRNEDISARAHCIFHQIEGLYINENVSFADLKQTLYYFVKELFGENTKIRFRPSFFPFTEPSAEMDISCNICGGKGCNICKYTGFLEILGCGMVNENVLKNCNIDSNKYTGFAFGMGIERIAMLVYGINDLRMFFENDVRFLKQFG